jgi:23S rRNA (adenine2503-C2)-methyltransferase
MRKNLYDLTIQALDALLAGWGYSGFHAELLWKGLYRQRVEDISQIAGLRPDLRARLAEEYRLEQSQPVAAQLSEDGTQKFLLQMVDGQTVETVLMPYRDRYSACISTQVGCAMGCVFCATGQMGFTRHLSAGEIVGQVLFLLRKLESPQVRAEKEQFTREIRNIVFMGMGEPLHNFQATMDALDILADDRGLAFAPRHLTVSTVGLPAAIRRLVAENRPVNLAVSLHGANDEERDRLVPIGRRWPLAELLDACREYCRHFGRRIFIEWALIEGENDTPEQAHALGSLLRDLDAHVNLIPLNPTSAYAGAPSSAAVVAAFQDVLRRYGLPSTVRQRRGLDIDAGCGQLRTREDQRDQPLTCSP